MSLWLLSDPMGTLDICHTLPSLSFSGRGEIARHEKTGSTMAEPEKWARNWACDDNFGPNLLVVNFSLQFVVTIP